MSGQTLMKRTKYFFLFRSATVGGKLFMAEKMGLLWKFFSLKHIKNLGDILANQWKELMSQIPGRKEGGKRFDTQDVE